MSESNNKTKTKTKKDRKLESVPAGDVVLMAGTDVTTVSIDEDGSWEMARQHWADYWPEGTIVLNGSGEVVGLKIGRVWLDGRGNVLTNIGPLLDAPTYSAVAPEDLKKLRAAFKVVIRARADFISQVVSATDAPVPGRRE